MARPGAQRRGARCPALPGQGWGQRGSAALPGIGGITTATAADSRSFGDIRDGGGGGGGGGRGLRGDAASRYSRFGFLVKGVCAGKAFRRSPARQSHAGILVGFFKRATESGGGGCWSLSALKAARCWWLGGTGTEAEGQMRSRSPKLPLDFSSDQKPPRLRKPVEKLLTLASLGTRNG